MSAHSSESIAGQRRPPPPPPKNTLEQGSRVANQLGTSAPVDNFSRLHLNQNGINPDTFVWVMGVDTVALRNGKLLSAGHIAELPTGDLCLFRYKPDVGFHMGIVPRINASIILEKNTESLSFLISIADDPHLQHCKVILHADTVDAAVGPWMNFLRPALCLSQPGLTLQNVAVGGLERVKPKNNEFGIESTTPKNPVVLGISGESLFILPTREEIRSEELLAWTLSDGEFAGLYLQNGVPKVFILHGHDSDFSRFLDELKPILPESKALDVSLKSYLSSMGVFTGMDCAPIILRKRDNELVVWSDTSRPTLCYAWILPSKTILATEHGECVVLSISSEMTTCLLDVVRPPEGMIQKSNNESWSLFFSNDSEQKPVRVIVASGTVNFIGLGIHPVDTALDIHVDPSTEGFVRVTTKWRKSDEVVEYSHLAPEQQGFAFWEWWDGEKAQVEVSKSGTASLYSQYNAARKNNFLLVIFGDILLLNRALESGTPMSELCTKLDEIGGVTFAEDKHLREETIAKTMLLASSLQDIKQKYEIISAMSPYYWVEAEAKWMTQAFGSRIASTAISSERKRLVPTVRRQVRSIQSDMFRSLGQIEAAIRPLESIFSREEVQRHWSSRLRVFAPQIAQAGLGVASLLIDPTGNTAFKLLGGAFATSALGGVLSHVQKDKEAAAQIQRAAQGIFPWWQIFMKTLVISIYEAGEFMDAENTVAMKRDRKFIESIPAEQKPAAMQRVNSALRMRIVEERKNRFGEILSGSGVRVMRIIEDIERSSGEQMKLTVDSFVETLVVTGKKKHK